MGLFRRKKPKYDTSKPSEPPKDQRPMSDRTFFDLVQTADDSYLTSLADKMLSGTPLILNFKPLDVDQANKIVAFLSGVVYAAKGEIVLVQEKVFLFARHDVFEDGSMEEFLKDFVE